MKTARAVSIDIGSTFTKAALVEAGGGRLALLDRHQVPTTPHHLPDAVDALLARWPADAGAPRYACSSAKGGLSVVAVGLVPDLTLTAARLAACSAGARVTGAYAYKLTDAAVREIEDRRPDILLLTGGTDGGNESYNAHNARMLAASRLDGVLLFAGNAQQQDTMRRLLAGKRLEVTENLMPEVGRLNLEPARAAIQAIFLREIVRGKGLETVAARCAGPVRPTPLAVCDLLGAVGRLRPDWEPLLLVDIGGATTDFYSLGEAFAGGEGTVLRGLSEPRLKRTVEGDLGLRVNAPAVVQSGPETVAGLLRGRGLAEDRFRAYVGRVAAQAGTLPSGAEEEAFDRILAEQCLRQAAVRHAGRIEPVYTPTGRVDLQRGKDLRPARRVIGSGGYLASGAGGGWMEAAFEAMAHPSPGARPLLPHPVEIWRDAAHLFPLLGNLVHDHPDAAVSLALDGLRRETPPAAAAGSRPSPLAEARP